MSSTIIRTIDILLCVKIILIIIPTRMSRKHFPLGYIICVHILYIMYNAC